MKRFHIHLHVHDLDKSIGFYAKLFACEPTRVEGDYAKWMLNDPRINFAISTRGSQPGIDHLGIQTDDPAELSEMKERAESADMALLDEGQTTCCYARSDKYWVTDPQGIAWEHFHTLGTIPVFKEAPAAVSTTSACCAPSPTPAVVSAEGNSDCAAASRGKPVGIPVKPPSSCC